MEGLEMNEEQMGILRDTFGTKDIYQEAVVQAGYGNEKFVASDGISYTIPGFMSVPSGDIVPKIETYKPAPNDSETVPWYRNGEGSGINLDNYVEPKESPKQGANVPEGDLIYEEQTENVALMESLQRRHGNKSRQELLELWAGEQHFINYNITALGYDAATLESMTLQEKTDYLLQMETWDKTKAFGDGSQGFWDQLWEIGSSLATDPTTYVGIGTFGLAFAGKEGIKQASKAAIMSFLRESTKQAIKTGAKVGAIEGTLYGGVDSALRQTIEQKAVEDITDMSDVQLDPARTAVDTAVGTVAGTLLGGTLAGGFKAISNKFKTGTIAADTIDELVATTPETAPASVIDDGVPKGAIDNVTVPHNQLPPNLRKGRANYGTTPITFENDLQKSLFLAGSKKKASKHYDTYVKFAMDSLGKSREQVIDVGRALQAQIGEKIAGRAGDETVPLHTDFSYFKMDAEGAEVILPQGNTAGKIDGTGDTIQKAEQDSEYNLENSGKTQVSTTVGTYKKVKERYFKDVDPSDVLDYGAGKGKASDELGFDSFEPNASGWEPMYTDATQITKKYKGIISNAVLNVLPKSVRDAVVKDIAEKLAPGGKAYINVRKLIGDVDKAKNPEVFEDGIITSRGTFQKGFNKQELLDYLTEMVGPGYKVESSPLGTLGAIITKLDDDVAKLDEGVDKTIPISEAQTVPTEVTDEQAALAQSRSDVEGKDLPTNPKDGAPINFERTHVFDEKTSQAIMDNYKLATQTVLNADTEKAARNRLMGFKTVDDIQTFLKNYSNKIEGLEIDATVVRMLYSSEANKVARAWSGAKTKSERMNILANNPALLQSLQAITIMIQRSGTAAGRVLQSQKINVDEFNSVLGNIADSAKTIRKVSDKARLEDKDVDVAIKEAFSDKDMDKLMEEMDNLIQITADHNDHVRRALPAFNRSENIFKKLERVATEVWLSANLSSLATQYGALAGSIIKRSTLKGESYLSWSIGKALNVDGRLKWNEMKALNEGNYAQSLSTLNMLFRMYKGGTGEGAEGIMQRESLDGWNTKWDDETTHGAINSGYMGFEDPNTPFKSIINKTLDVSGNIIRAPFSLLSLADDMMKRVYYLPHIKFQLTKEANQKFPNKDQSEAHAQHISRGVAAYELFYQKKGMRNNTMKRHVVGEMEKFNKNNPDATYEQIQAAEHDALASAEELVKFTPEEQLELDTVGIDDVKHENALEYLRGMLFQTDIPVDSTTRMGKLLKTVKTARDVTPLGQTQLPYLKTVLNMTKDTIQRVPLLNLISRDIRADLAAGGGKRVDAVSKMLLGGALITQGTLMYNNGLITSTTEMKDYQTDAAAGVKGGSIRFPGTDIFIPLERIEPIGSLWRFGADGTKMTAEVDRLRSIIDKMPKGSVDPDDENTLASWAADYALVMGTLSYRILSEKSGAKSIRNLVDALNNPESDSAQQYFNSYITGFIPLHAGIKQFNEDDTTKEAKSLFEHMRKKLGLMADKYGDRDTINFLGEVDNDLKRLNHVYWRTSQPKEGDYVMAKLYELQPGFRRADNEIQLKNGVVKELSYKEVYELRTLMDHPKINVRARLFKAMASKSFQSLPDGTPGEGVGYEGFTKIAALRKVYGEAKAAAQDLYESRHRVELARHYNLEIKKSKVSVNTDGSDQRSKVVSDFLGR